MEREIINVVGSKQLKSDVGYKPTLTPKKFRSNSPAKRGGY